MTPFPQSFGFVGLGAMGYPMAMQLRRKLPQTTPLSIFDLDKAALERFSQDCEGLGEIHIAESSRDVAERAVSRRTRFLVFITQTSQGMYYHNSSRRNACQSRLFDT